MDRGSWIVDRGLWIDPETYPFLWNCEFSANASTRSAMEAAYSGGGEALLIECL